MKSQTGNILVPELQYITDPNITLENKGMEKLNGTDTYKILVHLPGNVTRTEYYDMNSKLLLRTIDSTVQATNILDYSDYRKTGNILLSYKNSSFNSSGNLGKTEQIFTSIKINEGVTEADFK